MSVNSDGTGFPKLAILLGAAGLLPFFAAAWLAVASNEPLASQSATALLFYGAVILAFLGGAHWGFALGGVAPAGMSMAGPSMAGPSMAASSMPTDASHLTGERLMIGVLPALLGWAALLLGILAPADAGLPVLIAGFLGLVILEQRWQRRRLLPPGYMALRWVLTLVVVTLLAAVTILRILNIHLNF
jgi:hypothetical protein